MTTPDAKVVAGSDLDAVASAWGEPESKPPTTASDSSPVARSAEITTAVDQGASASEDDAQPASTGGRYALTEPADKQPLPDDKPATTELDKTAAVPAESAPAEASPTVAEQVASPPAPEIEPQVVAADTPDERDTSGPSADDAPAPAPANDTATAAVARGQEPNDAADLQALSSDTQNVEPQPIADANATSARQAVEDSRAPAAGGRYGAAASSGSAAAATDSGKPGLVNPFSAAAGTPNPPAATSETIEPLPPADGLPEPTELQTSNDLRPLRPIPPPQSSEPTAGNNLRDRRSIPQRGVPGRSEFSQAPPVNDGISNISLGAAAGNEGAGTPGEKALEGPQKPSLEIQKFAPAEIQVGKPAKFVVRVRNLGTQAAEGVTIRDEVPQGTKLVSTTPEAQNADGALVWNLGKLSPGEDRTVEMQLMPVSEGEIGSVATVSYSAQASVKTKCTMPQLAIRMTAPAKVMVGQEQRVKIEIRNPGSGDATGVMLFENVPQNVKHAAGPALEFEIGTLKAGETRELELVLIAEKAGKTVNVLNARADGNLQVQQQVEFEVIAPALTVGVEGPERRYLERPATYEVRVDNPGTATAHNVQIVTKLPKGMRFVKANNKGEYDAASHAVYWSLAELPEGDHGTVEVVAMPVETGPQTLEVETRAGEGLSDQAQRQIMIDGLAAIMFEVKDLEDPIEVGGETGYEIRVVNQGTKAATNVHVVVNLPPGMQLVSAEGETQHSEQGGAIVFEPLGQLAAKADTVYRLRTQGTTAGDQRVTVQVSTDDLAQPIRREESTLVYGDE
jgi:uncharacterized repeat protein (TIGR01451 family)